MSDLKIEDATPDTSVTGTEKIPVSDAGAAKFMTTEQMKDFVLAKVAALSKASAIDLSSNAVYIERDGSQMRMDANAFCDAVIGYIYGKSVASSLNGNEYFTIRNGSVTQTLSITSLKDWLKGNLGNTQIAALDSANALADEQFAVVSQTGVDKKVTLALIKAFCLAGLYASAAAVTDDIGEDDYLIFYSSGVLKKVKRGDAGFKDGDVIAPNTQNNGAIPAWDTTSKKLTSGYELTDTVADVPGGTTRIPTEAAVRSACNGALGGKTFVTSIGDQSTDAQIPTAKAVNTKISSALSSVHDDTLVPLCETSCMPGTVAMWSGSDGARTNTITSGLSITESIHDYDIEDDAIPTHNAVRSAIASAVPDDAESRIIALENKSATDFTSVGIVPYQQQFSRTGYEKGSLGIIRQYYNSTGSYGTYLVVNLGAGQSPDWKIVCKLDKSYPTA